MKTTHRFDPETGAHYEVHTDSWWVALRQGLTGWINRHIGSAPTPTAREWSPSPTVTQPAPSAAEKGIVLLPEINTLCRKMLALEEPRRES